MGPDPAVAAVRNAVRAELADLRPGSLVATGCSGGADSLALAAGLVWEAARAGLRAAVVAVDHGVQPGSDIQAHRAVEQVERLAAADPRGAGLEAVEVVRTEVSGAGGPEAAMRSARYAALEGAADRLGASVVLLGHTLDDQAETVLLGLGRGAGTRSLAGMPRRRGRYRRPLLDLTRATTRAACAALGLQIWDDPANLNPAHARVRVRTHALPALEEALGPGVAAALTRSARRLREDADALDDLAAAALPGCRREPWQQERDVGALVILDVRDLRRLSPALRSRVVHLAAVEAGVPRGLLSATHVLSLVALVGDWHGQGPVSLPGRVSGSRTPTGRIAFAAAVAGAGRPGPAPDPGEERRWTP